MWGSRTHVLRYLVNGGAKTVVYPRGVAQATGASKTTVYRVLREMAAAGWLSQRRDRTEIFLCEDALTHRPSVAPTFGSPPRALKPQCGLLIRTPDRAYAKRARADVDANGRCQSRVGWFPWAASTTADNRCGV
ncbi:helix-turn-helix domain-containing protein [Nocardia tengchongensis]|uniref:helix-turn-helix domain-containing protein n=1 Tax=Nocardia tengchongensis TaxID=2055889 RepID=UPI0036ADDE05